ncbi:hypothetical protein EK904_001931 [Melospiza melodia maxima]|nr:hypothetical protein EK904_001931 [Melospiza melodia maxima]
MQPTSPGYLRAGEKLHRLFWGQKNTVEHKHILPMLCNGEELIKEPAGVRNPWLDMTVPNKKGVQGSSTDPELTYVTEQHPDSKSINSEEEEWAGEPCCQGRS